MALFRPQVSTGLDIGSSFVKAVSIDHSKPEPELVRLCVRPLDPPAIVDGEVMDRGALAETVRSVMKTAAPRRASVIVGIGGHDVIIRKIDIERMSPAHARDAIRWEAEQQVPFDMDSIHLDFQILDPQADEPHMSVLLVAAKQELIEDSLRLLAEAGVRPAIVDVDAFALHNAFEHGHGPLTHGLSALVHVGHESTNVNIVEDGVPVLVRNVPFGSRRVQDWLERERGLGTAAAAAIIRDGNAQGTDMRAFLTRRADELAIGVERAVAFVTAQSASRLDRIFLSGGGARIPGVAEAIRRRVGTPCELVSPLDRIAVRPEAIGDVELERIAPMLTLCVGLALRRSTTRRPRSELASDAVSART